MAKGAPQKVCGKCEHFVGPKTLPEDTAIAARIMAADLYGAYSVGSCLRFPATVTKKPDDYCGEFKLEGKS